LARRLQYQLHHHGIGAAAASSASPLLDPMNKLNTIGTVRNFSVNNYKVANVEARALKTTFDLLDPNTVTNCEGHKQLTKIVATIGPTSEQLEPLQKVVKAGMKIMRLNFSHATREEVELRLKNLSLCQVSFLVLVDVLVRHNKMVGS
jgi:hypothetical protein